jgi:hypothetical protein
MTITKRKELDANDSRLFLRVNENVKRSLKILAMHNKMSMALYLNNVLKRALEAEIKASNNAYLETEVGSLLKKVDFK